MGITYKLQRILRESGFFPAAGIYLYEFSTISRSMKQYYVIADYGRDAMVTLPSDGNELDELTWLPLKDIVHPVGFLEGLVKELIDLGKQAVLISNQYKQCVFVHPNQIEDIETTLIDKGHRYILRSI